MTRLLTVVAGVALLAGCASSPESPAASDAQSPPASTSQGLVIDVTIKDGTVTPTNEQLRAGLDEPIVIRVDSDAADELHVHSSPEHSFPVAVGPAQSFEFSVAVPGRVDVELHETHTTIATIQVQ
ncbi:hypothetical protein [Mycolicibacterium gilvum]|uniref:EfeO-type cupredoxin-like domain-containing protein n=1 Tax=Mycolicibacterium gilvum (strain DSM 45189 / LMG 24558 / Spyr1) TaxID=278137 RepID=E6TML8_MYCSR|nr:hypothetical protein [Mycolicibacterium gilvum]ADU01624.1 hypothetical protein Mspyr1_50960 [Mycolicibacterium gilvum Spyr1]